MAFCAKCGATVEDDIKICPACGAAIPVSPEEAAKQQQQPAPEAVAEQTSSVNAAVGNAAESAKKAFAGLNKTMDTTASYEATDIEENKLWAILSYVFFLFFLPLVICPNSRFGKYHANQGCVLFICEVIAGILMGIIGFIPVKPLVAILDLIIGVPFFVVMLIGIINAINGKAKELPIIGSIVIIK